MQKIIICPNDTKLKILKEDKTSTLTNQKFMTKQEFLDHYYGEYQVDAIYYLMKKYNYHIDVAKVYIKNLMYIEDKSYKSKKLNFLKDLKKELEPFHINHPTFRNSLKKKEIIVKNIYDLEPIDQKNISYSIKIPNVELNNKVYEFSSLEKEVNFICIEIRKLLEKNIPLNKIFLVNAREEYYYTLDKMFSYYKIPIMIPYKNSIYGTKIVKDYLDTSIYLESDDEITSKLRNILGNLGTINEDEIKKEIIISELKETYLNNPVYEESITIKNIKDRDFKEDEYVFLLGFNQDTMPSITKDIDYLNDQEKEELNLYTSKEKNILERKVIPYIISNIKNLTITYKLSSPFEKYYPSSFIQDYQLEVIKEIENSYEYSTMYNKIQLGELLDDFYIYGDENKDLIPLYSTYDINYDTYTNKYTNIKKDTYLENLPVPLRLSYTTLNTYNECAFKYYINNVLKLNPYEDKFETYVGSLYHHILEKYYPDKDFDFEKEWNSYLEKRELTLKEMVLLKNIKEDVLKFLEVLKKQNTYTNYKEEYHEKNITPIKIREDIAVEFVGKIDKIMAYHNLNDTYYSIIDYKSGTIDTDIRPMQYGLHMQLPIYLYLINYAKLFENPIFTGIYYQNILLNKNKWTPKIEEEEKKKYYLQGYSTDDMNILEKFDISYKDSEVIRSMKYKEDKGFGKDAKVIDSDLLYKIVTYTKKLIEDKTQDILDRKFTINPIKVENKDDACKYCKLKDLCYKTYEDEIRPEKVKELSSIGGDENETNS